MTKEELIDKIGKDLHMLVHALAKDSCPDGKTFSNYLQSWKDGMLMLLEKAPKKPSPRPRQRPKKT